MKINRKKQQGATLVTWLIVAGFAFLTASAVVKVAPYYVEFRNVKGLMSNIASTNGVKKFNLRQINRKIEKHLDINQLYALEYAYYKSRKGVKGSQYIQKPFTLKKLRKGKNRRALTVNYDVPAHWIGNLSFLIKFNHSVILGEPDEKIEIKRVEVDSLGRKQKLNLR